MKIKKFRVVLPLLMSSICKHALISSLFVVHVFAQQPTVVSITSIPTPGGVGQHLIKAISKDGKFLAGFKSKDKAINSGFKYDLTTQAVTYVINHSPLCPPGQINPLSCLASPAYAINDLGQTAGAVNASARPSQDGVELSRFYDSLTGPVVSRTNGIATHISESGLVLGRVYNTSTNPGTAYVAWKHGIQSIVGIELHGIGVETNSSDEILSYRKSPNGTSVMIETLGSSSPQIKSSQSYLSQIDLADWNDRSVIVGTEDLGSSSSEAVLISPKGLKSTLPAPASHTSKIAVGINNESVVLVNSKNSSGNRVAYLVANNQVINLNALIGSTNFTATAISDVDPNSNTFKVVGYQSIAYQSGSFQTTTSSKVLEIKL